MERREHDSTCHGWRRSTQCDHHKCDKRGINSARSNCAKHNSRDAGSISKSLDTRNHDGGLFYVRYDVADHGTDQELWRYLFLPDFSLGVGNLCGSYHPQSRSILRFLPRESAPQMVCTHGRIRCAYRSCSSTAGHHAGSASLPNFS